jgi:exopolyphosphatase/guanosine-5'-triphosphate,3'-diphosphate pyrophosphatase
MKLAAIDIGSNAVRLLIEHTSTMPNGQINFTKVNFTRIPIRLGMDVFTTGKISEEKKNLLIDTFTAFQYLLKVYDVKLIKVYATSAFRDAENGQILVEDIKKKTGIEIKILNGEEETNLIQHILQNEIIPSTTNALTIDVGGGSTEVSILKNNKIIYNHSFDIGTIRMMNGQVTKETWEFYKEKIKKNSKLLPDLTAYATGGNINKIFSMSKIKDGNPIDLKTLKKYQTELSALTVEQRMLTYKLREDRADVIVPALEIYTSAMRWAGIDKMYVPQIGLVDAIIRELYYQHSFTSLRM